MTTVSNTPDPDLVFADAAQVGAAELLDLFRALDGDPFFHPHPLDEDFISWLHAYRGRDRYLVCGRRDGRLLGYGLLRGWDTGFVIPSLGIALRRDARGRGIAWPFLQFLHTTAAQAGASQVRLRVHPENATALAFYRKHGYAETGVERGEIVLISLIPKKT